VWMDTSVGGTNAGLIAVAWLHVTPSPDEVLFSAVNVVVVTGGSEAPVLTSQTAYKLMAAGVI